MSNKLAVNIDTVEYAVTGFKFDLPGVTKAVVTSSDGEVLDERSNRLKILPQQGNHALHVRALDFGNSLTVSGSLGGFLHGQNVFTSDDLGALCVSTLKQICRSQQWTVPPETRARWKEGDIKLSRVDLACNFMLDSEAEVREILNQLRWALPARGAAVKLYRTTAYLMPDDGKDHQVVFYAKGPEMRRKAPASKPSNAFVDRCANILRVELRLTGALARLNLQQLGAWQDDTAETVFRDVFKGLRFLDLASGPLSVEELKTLPQRLKPALAAYKAGMDLNLLYKSPTLRNHMRDFRSLGINIDCPNRPEKTSTSLLRALTPKNALPHAPAWLDEVMCGTTRAVASKVDKEEK